MKRIIFAVVLAILSVGSLGQDNAACPTGFTGANCGMCQNDAACVASTGAATATCFQDIPIQNNTRVKTVTCDPTAPDLILNLIVPDSMVVQCFTRPGSAAPTPPAPVTPAPAPTDNTLPPAVAPAPDAGGVLTPAPADAPAPAPPLTVNGTDLSGLLQDAGQALGRRLFQDTAGNATSDAPYCTVGFQVKSPSVTVACRADGCTLTPGTSDFLCKKTTCECVNDPTCAGNSLITSLAGLVNGKAELRCGPAPAPGQPAACTLLLEGLPLSNIEGTCTAAECLVPEDIGPPPSNNTTNGDDEPKPSVPSNVDASDPVIAAIPTMFLTVVCVFVGTYTWINRNMWTVANTAARGSGPGSPGAAAAAAAARRGKKVGVLEFRDVAVTVPMAADVAERKHAAIRTKALARHDSMHTDMHHAGLTTFIPRRARARLGIKGNDVDGVRLSQEETLTLAASSGSTELFAAAEFVSALHGSPSEGTWTVVRECTGTAAAGEVVGVLGPSGCGKTTLLGAIAGSALDLGSSANLMGTILVDGVPRKGRDVAYVPQADNLIPTLTVAECVRYSALLRLPRSTPTPEVHARVAGVLEELGLRHIADSQVGGAGRIRGISGGERRRVTIGMELVTDPSIIVLDEPTSGLDSFTAINLVRSLRTVAAGGRVVIASLHQPSKDMFFALDRVILMGHGRILFGGRPEEAEGALAAAGVPCPPDTAVAEHMLEVASRPEDIMAMLKYRQRNGTGGLAPVGPRPGSAAGTDGASVASAVSKQPSNDSNESPDALMEAATPPQVAGLRLDPVSAAASTVSPRSVPLAEQRPAGFARQLAVMFWRTAVDILRNPTLLLLHCGIAIIVGIFQGAIFFDLQLDSGGIQNRMGGTFFALAFLAFTSLTTVDVLMNERTVVMREVRSGYYGPGPYLLSKLALDGMLLRTIPAVLFWIPFYYMAGFKTASINAALYCFALVAFNCCIGALSMAVTVGSNTPGQAAFIMNFVLLFALAFTGFLVKIQSIPAALRWIHYLSPFFYAFEAMIASETNGMKILFEFQLTPTSPVTSVPDLPAETVPRTLGLDMDAVTRDVWILVAWYAFYMLLTLALFIIKMPRTHKSKGMKRGSVAAGASSPPAPPLADSPNLK